MKILIVEDSQDLGTVWKRHLERSGAEVSLVQGQAHATHLLQDCFFDVIVLDLMLTEGSCLAIADFVSYRWPQTRVVFVTGSTFFSDGSLFSYVGNACALVPRNGPPEDLAAVVQHYATAH